MARRDGIWLVVAALVLHGIGMARAGLPAQDGLKFLRVAREFQSQPFTDVVRASDQHPLYPALVAAVEPAMGWALGRGPTAWRIAGQGVSALASIGMLLPLFGLTRALFGPREAWLSAWLCLAVPGFVEIGHETLSDALGLCAFTTALWLGVEALRGDKLTHAVGCGLAGGIGYWARPEVALVPVVVLMVAAGRRIEGFVRSGGWPPFDGTPQARRLAALGLVFLASIGAYATVKGEVSEKLALRRSAGLSSKHDVSRRKSQPLPAGMDERRLDFTPKEDARRPRHDAAGSVVTGVLAAWTEGIGWLLAGFAVWGAWRVRAGSGRILVAAYLALLAAILVRHRLNLGYLSGRHALSAVVATLPWAAAGLTIVGRRLGDRFGLGASSRGLAWKATLASLMLAGLVMQVRPSHPTRAGHLAAGRWLLAHAGPGDAVLDTRGWANFVSGRVQYDPWHIRQALTDARLRYVVIGAEEVEAPSRRGATWRALLAFAAHPVAEFADPSAGRASTVRIYRFERPSSWEGLTP